MFLSNIEDRHAITKARVREIRHVLGSAEVPVPTAPGVTNGLRIPFDIRDRLVEIQSRHGMGSSKEVIYKAMLLGLHTLERLEPASGPIVRRRSNVLPNGSYRALSEDDVSRLRDGGYR
jgi:hypothetical protein